MKALLDTNIIIHREANKIVSQDIEGNIQNVFILQPLKR